MAGLYQICAIFLAAVLLAVGVSARLVFAFSWPSVVFTVAGAIGLAGLVAAALLLQQNY